MAKRSKLLGALDAHKGRDFEAERQKKLQRLAAKRKQAKSTKEDIGEKEQLEVPVNGTNGAPAIESEGWESDESELADASAIQTSGIFDDESDSDSSLGGNQDRPIEEEEAAEVAGDEDEEDEDSVSGGIPLSDIDSLSSAEKADILPHQRLTINNIQALSKSLKSIILPYATLPFSAHQTITTAIPVTIPDVNDDLKRELEFYRQCLEAANQGRTALKKEGIPFTRPTDYFAEMVKSEEQMGKVKQKLVDEAASKKAASEARRQRDLKKFGKQVQVAKLQERSKAKREALEKIEVLKRKRKNTDTGLTNEEDLFDIALEAETKQNDRSKNTSSGSNLSRKERQQQRSDGPPNKRAKKNEKFGFGGKKRFAKSNDAVSTGDMKGFSAKKMKGGGGKTKTKTKTRLGKSRRAKNV